MGDSNLNPWKDWYHRLTCNLESCTNWYNLSEQGSNDKYVELEGNPLVPYKPDKKYEDLIQIFKNDIPYSNIKLEAPVIKIDYSDDTVDIKIMTQNGTKYEADVVIFTASLGVLKDKGRDIFHPSLPEDKMEAIDKIGFGVIAKIFLEFETSPWPWKDNFIQFLFKDDGISYTAQEAESDWTRFILEAYFENFKTRIVSLWLSGEGAKRVESLNLDQIKSDSMKFLRKMTRNLKNLTDFPNPINIQVPS